MSLQLLIHERHLRQGQSCPHRAEAASGEPVGHRQPPQCRVSPAGCGEEVRLQTLHVLTVGGISMWWEALIRSQGSLFTLHQAPYKFLT